MTHKQVTSVNSALRVIDRKSSYYEGESKKLFYGSVNQILLTL